MGTRQLLRPHFCSMLAAVVQRSAAARGAAKGAVQWKPTWCGRCCSKKCVESPTEPFCEFYELRLKKTMGLLRRRATEIALEVFETGQATQEEEAMAELP